MSHTYRLVDYLNGKPIYTRHENDAMPFYWARHEFPHVRRHTWKQYRLACRDAVKKCRDPPRFCKTRGWITW